MNTVRHILQIKGNYIWSVTPEDTVLDMLRLMANKDVGALVVVEDKKLIGIVSERDYARKVILFGKQSKDTLVREIMTTNVVTIHPDQTVEECMELMTQKRIRHLPVCDGDRLQGMISIGDVVNNIITRQRRTISELEDKVLGSTPPPVEPAVPRFPSPPKK